MRRPFAPRRPVAVVLLALAVPALLGATVTVVPAAAALPVATAPGAPAATERVGAATTQATATRPTDPGAYLTTQPGRGRFPLVEHGRAASIVVSSGDFPGVVRVVDDLQSDLESVSGIRPAVSRDAIPAGGAIVVVGTIGRSPLIDGLVAAGKLDVSAIKGKWETSLQEVVQNPIPDVGQALVIAGSDQRGTIYGAYDVSRRIGVSPWYFWDD